MTEVTASRLAGGDQTGGDQPPGRSLASTALAVVSLLVVVLVGVVIGGLAAGYRPVVILTGSMGETAPPGSLVVAAPVDGAAVNLSLAFARSCFSCRCSAVRLWEVSTRRSTSPRLSCASSASATTC